MKTTFWKRVAALVTLFLFLFPAAFLARAQETGDPKKEAATLYKEGVSLQNKKKYEEAREAFRKALEKDPKHASAQRALERLEKKLADVAGKKEADLRSRLVGLDLTIASKEDCTRAQLDDLAGRTKEASWILFQITHGQIYIAKIAIADKTEEGEVFIPTLTGPVQPRTRVGERMTMPFNYNPYLFIHEFGHLKFMLLDEYAPMAKKPCSRCWMANGTELANARDFFLCDKTTHDGEGPDCWSRILQMYPQLRWEPHVKGKDYGKPPEAAVTFNDR